jgi:hypothetical protein
VTQEKENDQLAEQFQSALIAELTRRNAPYIEATAVNMGNVNIDVLIRYDKRLGSRSFKYMGIERLRQLIGEKGLNEYAREFVVRYLEELQEHLDFDSHIAQDIESSKNLQELLKKVRD